LKAAERAAHNKAGLSAGEKVIDRVGTMPRRKRGKKSASLDMLEDSSLLEEVDIPVDPIEALEEGTVDSFTNHFGPNAEIDLCEVSGMDLELPFDQAELASAGIQDISFLRFHGSEIDDESGRELFDTAGLKTTGLGPEEASAVAYGVAEAESISSYESLDDGDAKETTATAGLKTTGLEPEQLSSLTNRAEGAIGGWPEANPSTELQLGRQLSARRQIPVHAVINRLRMEKKFDGLTDKQLIRMVCQGLSHKKPILPSTDSISETRVQGTSKVPKRISRKGTGKKRGNYKKKTADKELLKFDAKTSTANGGESISFLNEQEMPRFKETFLSVSQPQAGSEVSPPQVESEVSQPQAGSEDVKVDNDTVKKPVGKKKVMSDLCVPFDSWRPHRLIRFFNLKAGDQCQGGKA
jgi:hypothetical protein